MVNTPPRLTPLRYLSRDVLNQMVNISNRYTRYRLVVILLIIGMISLSNPFQQTLYNRNNTHKSRMLKYKNHVNILTNTQVILTNKYALANANCSTACVYMLQVEDIYH